MGACAMSEVGIDILRRGMGFVLVVGAVPTPASLRGESFAGWDSVPKSIRDDSLTSIAGLLGPWGVDRVVGDLKLRPRETVDWENAGPWAPLATLRCL